MELTIYQTSLLIAAGINVLLGLSVYVMFSTGQLSLGTAGFMALGAYVSSVLTMELKWDLNLSLVIGGAAAAAIGVLLAFPALRLRGIYLAFATMAYSEIVRIFFEAFPFTGAAVGYRGMSGTTLLQTAIWVAVVLVVFWRLYASRIGRAFHAVEIDETVAEGMGLDVTLIKVAAFAISGFVGGVAGALYAHDLGGVAPYQFTLLVSIIALLIVILGSLETFWGVILGAAIISFLPETLRFMKDWKMVAYGAIFVVILIFRPSGLLTNDTFNFLSRRHLRPKGLPFVAQDRETR